MKRILLTLAGTAAMLATVAGAQIANPDPSAVRAGTYAVEAGHTRVQFAVSHFGFSNWFGDFTDASGTLTLDPARVGAGKVEISLPITSVKTTNSHLDNELKGAEWFDAAKYPTATFTSTSITSTGPRTADIAGTLTLRGVTKPLVLHATFNGAGVNPIDKAYTVGFDAKGTFKRSDFGVTKYAPLVSDDVQLNISAAFVRKD